MELPGKKKWTNEERAALSKKLDDELEQFMEEMAAKKKENKEEKKPFDFDEWCKEIDQHPAFMKEMNPTGKYADTIEALQAMKYDKEDDEDHLANAEHHKKEGNKHFGFKKYRWATDCYTNGIKEKCDDKKLNAILYFNRAAAQKHIGNLRSAIKDCTMGRKFDATNLKGAIRGAECLLELEYAKDALNWIETSKKMFAFLKETSEDPELTEEQKKQIDELEKLRVNAVKASCEEERNKRKSRAEERKEVEKNTKLLNALKARNVNLSPRVPFDHPELMDMGLITVSISNMHTHEVVKFDDEDNLTWPILLQYPEVGTTDVLTEVNEKSTVGELLERVLAEPTEWDPEHKYKLENVRFFVADQYDEYLMEIYEWNEFGAVLSLPGYQIRQGFPVIMVLTKDHVDKSLKLESEDENRFIAK